MFENPTFLECARHNRLKAKELVWHALLIHFEAIPELCLTRADRVMMAVIRYYLK